MCLAGERSGIFSLPLFWLLGVYPCWECTVLRYCTFLGYNIIARLAGLLLDYYFLSFDHRTMVSYYLDMGLFIPIDQRGFLSFSKTGDFLYIYYGVLLNRALLYRFSQYHNNM